MNRMNKVQRLLYVKAYQDHHRGVLFLVWWMRHRFLQIDNGARAQCTLYLEGRVALTFE